MTATTSTPPRETARPPIPRAGWVVVASKEIGDHVSSIRFVVLVILLGIAAGIPLYFAADTIREAAERASEAAAVFLALFTIGEETPYITLRVDTFVALVAPLLGIIFAFDAINSERHDGTLPRLLSQPIHRDDVINGKFAAGLAVIGIVLVAMLAIVSGYGMFRLGIVPEAGEVFRLLGWTAATFVYVALWLAFGLLLSVAIRNTATAALVGFGTWLFLTLFGPLVLSFLAPILAPVSGGTNEQIYQSAVFQDTITRLLPSKPLPGDLGRPPQPERDAGVRAGDHRPGDPGQPADRDPALARPEPAHRVAADRRAGRPDRALLRRRVRAVHAPGGPRLGRLPAHLGRDGLLARRTAGECLDDPVEVGLAAVLGELSLCIDPLEAQLEPDDRLRLQRDEVGRRVVDAPRFVPGALVRSTSRRTCGRSQSGSWWSVSRPWATTVV